MHRVVRAVKNRYWILGSEKTQNDLLARTILWV